MNENQNNDAETTILALREIVKQFVAERDWQQFHSPKNLAGNLMVEAAELLENFLWVSPEASNITVEKNRQKIEEELGDVLFVLLALCNATHIDATNALRQKIIKTAKNYPADTWKGIAGKYKKE